MQNISLGHGLNTAIYESIDKLINALTTQKIMRPNDFNSRYQLLDALFSRVAPMLNDEQQKEGVESLHIMLIELNKLKRHEESYFIYISNEFERELIQFVFRQSEGGRI